MRASEDLYLYLFFWKPSLAHFEFPSALLIQIPAWESLGCLLPRDPSLNLHYNRNEPTGDTLGEFVESSRQLIS